MNPNPLSGTEKAHAMPKNASGTERDAIFDALNLSEDERRYIEVSRYGVSLRFHLKMTVSFAISTEKNFSLNDKRLRLDSEAQGRLHELLTEFWEREAERGGFELQSGLNDLSELNMFKEATTEDEVRAAVMWLVGFKRRFGV